mgnify:CR=1 FL=1
MAITIIPSTIYTEELALNKLISVEQNFAQQAYIVFKEIKFGITPCCYSDFESAAITHSIYKWKYSKSKIDLVVVDPCID